MLTTLLPGAKTWSWATGSTKAQSVTRKERSPLPLLHAVLHFRICLAFVGPMSPVLSLHGERQVGSGRRYVLAVSCPYEGSVTQFPHLAMTYPEALAVSALGTSPSCGAWPPPLSTANRTLWWGTSLIGSSDRNVPPVA